MFKVNTVDVTSRESVSTTVDTKLIQLEISLDLIWIQVNSFTFTCTVLTNF